MHPPLRSIEFFLVRLKQKQRTPRDFHRRMGVVVMGLLLVSIGIGYGAESTWKVVTRTPAADQQVHLEVFLYGTFLDGTSQSRPCRVIMKDPAGKFYDGSGKGVYRDGRFFVQESFEVTLTPGSYQLEVSSGPNFVPLETRLDFSKPEKIQVRVDLAEWFSPEQIGWYAGDHHVHAQHDRKAEVQTSLAYAALQAKSNGLTFVTEAGSNVDYATLNQLSDARFQMRFAGEIRPGPFVGHLNTPGITAPIPEERLNQISRQPLPVKAIRAAAEELGGMVIQTHPLTPRHQIHWMGAAEYYSDIVGGHPAHALDIDSRATDYLLFAGLNLGNRIAVSSYTDGALGRTSTLAPGDRRVYVWLPPEEQEAVSYDSMVESFRQGHSIATNGGPLFATWSIQGQPPGSEIDRQRLPANATARLHIHHRFPVSHIEIYRRGKRIAALDGTSADPHWETDWELPADLNAEDWLVLRVQDDRGHWVLTSPFYFGQATKEANGGGLGAIHGNGSAHAVLLQISNATRFIELRRQFYAHMIVTVNPRRTIQKVALRRDGEIVATFLPDHGQKVGRMKKLPVTEIHGEYEDGWVWHPSQEEPNHFQADWQVKDAGWYSLEFLTEDGAKETTTEIYFDPEFENSHQVGCVHVRGPDTELELLGYSEEMPLAEIKLPFEGDHWWYPRNTLFLLRASLGGQTYEQQNGADAEFVKRFRPRN